MKTSKKSVKQQPQVLVVHLKKKSGSPHRVATLVAFKAHDGVVRIGYAKCRTHVVKQEGEHTVRIEKDQFDNAVGYNTALGRAASLLYAPNMVAELKVPQSIEAELKKFIGRSSRFFKSEEVQVCGLTAKQTTSFLQEWKEEKVSVDAA